MSNDHGAAYWCDQYHKIEQQLAEAKKKLAEHEKTAKSRYIDLCVDDEVTDPIERLRVFCSLLMNLSSEDWLYCERFFDEISALLAKAKEEGRAEAQGRIRVLEDALSNFIGNPNMDGQPFRKAAEALSTSFPTEALDKVVREAVVAKQAEIDRLMMEFCPEDMTPEQVENWKQHQKPYGG